MELTDEGREAVAAALLEGYPCHQIAKAIGTTVKTLKRIIDGNEALLDAIEARRDADEAELRELLMGMARQSPPPSLASLASSVIKPCAGMCCAGVGARRQQMLRLILGIREAGS